MRATIEHDRQVQTQVVYDAHPDHYRHWKLSFDGAIATLALGTDEEGGIRPGYRLKLNSYDLGVDIELHDALQRIRFEHPEVRSVVISSSRDRIFCSGANIFCTLTEGVRAPRAKEWRLVDDIAKPQQFAAKVNERAVALAQSSDRPLDAKGVTLTPLARTIAEDGYAYEHVSVRIDKAARTATLTVAAPTAAEPESIDAIIARGAKWWPLAMTRELDDAILMLRTNQLDVGTWILKTSGDIDQVLHCDAALAKHARHWFVRETIGMLRRTLARLDVTSRTLFALIDKESCFA